MNSHCILRISGGNTPMLEGGYIWIKSVKGFNDSKHFEKGVDYPFMPDLHLERQFTHCRNFHFASYLYA